MKANIVFDMDGVLVDTERLKLRAHRAAVRDAGGTLTEEQYRREMGGMHREVIRAFLHGSDLEASERAVDAHEERFRQTYRTLLARELAPMEGAVEVLDACQDEGRRLALVTSSDRWMAELVLSRLSATDRFDAVITADDVGRTKPHPEPYRRARSALATSGPAVAVEDTPSGVESAVEAGLPVVAVRHDLNREVPFPRASAVVDSLAPAAEFLALVDDLLRDGDRLATKQSPPR